MTQIPKSAFPAGEIDPNRRYCVRSVGRIWSLGKCNWVRSGSYFDGWELHSLRLPRGGTAKLVWPRDEIEDHRVLLAV